MAEHGAWSKKGATLSDATALKEYGVDTEFIINGIRSGDLEYREGAIWGNPYIRVLRSQLETYIAKERGSDHLATVKAKAELRAIAKDMREIEQRLTVLQARKAALEQLVHKTH